MLDLSSVNVRDMPVLRAKSSPLLADFKLEPTAAALSVCFLTLVCFLCKMTAAGTVVF